MNADVFELSMYGNFVQWSGIGFYTVSHNLLNSPSVSIKRIMMEFEGVTPGRAR